MASDPCTLLWIDLETTGLNIAGDHIIEVACFVTNPNGTQPRDEMEWVINPASIDSGWLKYVDPYVSRMHTDNGLFADIEDHGIGWNEFAGQFFGYIQNQIANPMMIGNKLTVSGSGVGPFDLPMLKMKLPGLDQFLNYFVCDTGVIGRFLRHNVGIDLPERATVPHRALDDIKEHYEEFLQYKAIFSRGA